ncbi:hypothetical protein Tco_0838108 [Tanacetum coccineum]|uniref:Uncharacterized protein n=1 Tax=Tanacetum coccineum TaxID=301880 RepID=A0ABQ5AQQ4_9ASTR
MIDDTVRARRYIEWCTENNTQLDYESTSIPYHSLAHRGITNPNRQEDQILSIKSYFPILQCAVLNEWILDSFDVEADFAGICNNPYSRGLEEYKAMRNVNGGHVGNYTHGTDDRFKVEKRCKSGLEEKYYDPLQVCIETFEVKRYSLEEGKSFVCVTKQLEDALPLGWLKESRFKEMIRKEMDMDGSVQREM